MFPRVVVEVRQRQRLHERGTPWLQPWGGCQEDQDVHRLVAGNPNATETVLLRASRDRSPSVREAVARNPKIPQDVAIHLSTSKVSRIRQALSENPAVPEHIRVGLSL